MERTARWPLASPLRSSAACRCCFSHACPVSFPHGSQSRSDGCPVSHHLPRRSADTGGCGISTSVCAARWRGSAARRAVLKVLADAEGGGLNGVTIARRAGSSYSGTFRAALASMAREGLLTLGAEGYELAEQVDAERKRTVAGRSVLTAMVRHCCAVSSAVTSRAERN
jgi:hypothetical protein